MNLRRLEENEIMELAFALCVSVVCVFSQQIHDFVFKTYQ